MALGRIAIMVLVVTIPGRLEHFEPLAARVACPGACTQATSEELAAFRSWVAGPISYLLSEKERKIAETLLQGDAAVRSQYLTGFRDWFWERRDPIPESHHNEFRERFTERVDYVNKEFGGPDAAVPGWRTARGAVYVLLGPPTRIELREARLYGEFDAVTVDLWVYDLAGLAVLELPFVEAAGAIVLLTTPENLGMQGRLNAALARASVDSIRNGDLVFTGASPLTSAAPPSEAASPRLSIEGSLVRARGGVEAEIVVPLDGLYGRVLDGDLLIELRLEFDVPGDAARRGCGNLAFVIRPADFERWQDRAITVAAWLPFDDVGDLVGLTVTELASGRSATLAAPLDGAAITRAYAVGHLLGGASLLDGAGAAFVFVREVRPTGVPGDSLWVLRPPSAIEGTVIEEPVTRLQLIRAGSDDQ